MDLKPKYAASLSLVSLGADQRELSFSGNASSLALLLTPVLTGAPGPEGPPGPSGEVIECIAQDVISALRVVSQGSGGVVLCDPTDVNAVASIIGISVTAASLGNAIQVRKSGTLTDSSWSWVAGQPLFCTSSGVITSTAPNTTASRQVAIAIDATTILVSLTDLIILE